MTSQAELRKAANDLRRQVKDLEMTFGTLLPREATNVGRRTLVSIARQIRDDIRGRAPAAEGTLRRAIRSGREKAPPLKAEAGVRVTHGSGVKNDAFYWRFLEFGTQKLAARPYIMPTITEWRQKISVIFAQEWWSQVQREVAKRARR